MSIREFFRRSQRPACGSRAVETKILHGDLPETQKHLYTGTDFNGQADRSNAFCRGGPRLRSFKGSGGFHGLAKCFGISAENSGMKFADGSLGSVSSGQTKSS